VPVRADNQLTPDEERQGWQLLFDGKDLSGWVMKNGQPAPSTAIQDGMLNPHMQPRARVIYTKGRYANFVLACDYKMSKGCNSGIFIRVGDPKSEVQTGLEIQVEDTADKEMPGKNDGGALYDILAPSKNMVKPAGEWNHCEITADKNVIKVVLNGAEVINADLDKYTKPGQNLDGGKNKYKKAIKDFPREGLIGLQDHGHDCWFKNIKIKVLK
jgi:3-keto-disaccharide hydrolase